MRDKTVRCDNCGSEAWVSVNRVDAGQLDFCAHHYHKNSILLHAQGWMITNDERDVMNVKLSPSATAPVNG